MVKIKAKVKGGNREIFKFSVSKLGVLFAGSKHGSVPEETCNRLIKELGDRGFGFWVGCSSGVSSCFRKALINSEYIDKSFVGCAFISRAKTISKTGLFASVVSPKNLTGKSAVIRRTLWLIKRASLVVLFPDNPNTGKWDKESKIIFNSSLYQLKPVFVVSSHPVGETSYYRVIPSILHEVEGYWAVPEPIEEGGFCDDEF